MRNVFSRYKLTTVLVIFLLFSLSSAVGQIWIDGEEISNDNYNDYWTNYDYRLFRGYTNYDDIASARVNGTGSPMWGSNANYLLFNNGRIDDEVWVDGSSDEFDWLFWGWFGDGCGMVHNGTDGGSGYIKTANIAGLVYNGINDGTGTIGTANVNARINLDSNVGDVVGGGVGVVYNGKDGGTGYIGTANVEFGYVYNGINGSTGYIETANVSGGNIRVYFDGNYTDGGIGFYEEGYVYNGKDGGTGSIDTVNVDGGRVYNGSNGGTGYIGTANVERGYVYNGSGYAAYNYDRAPLKTLCFSSRQFSVLRYTIAYEQKTQRTIRFLRSGKTTG